MPEGFRLPVDINLDAYRESWQAGHEAAMACRDWEEVVGMGLAAFGQLDAREDEWRQRVFAGSLPLAQADDWGHKARLQRWLESTRPLLERVLPALEQRFGAVEGAGLLRQRAAEARRRLAEWKPPSLSAAVGLREMTLTPEAVADLDRILEEGKRNPPPRYDERMQTMSGEEFLRRQRAKNP